MPYYYNKKRLPSKDEARVMRSIASIESKIRDSIARMDTKKQEQVVARSAEIIERLELIPRDLLYFI